MKNIISKHKIEIVYIVVILLLIIYGTVTAHAEVSSNVAEEPQIVIETEVETEPETTTPDFTELEEEPPKEVFEDVESEKVDKEVSENSADMVVEELSPEEHQQVENGDLTELIDIMKTIVILLFAEIVGFGLLLGSIWCGKAFGWLQ